MQLRDAVHYLQQRHKEMKVSVPSLHVVLGSITAHAIDDVEIDRDWTSLGEIYFKEIPNFSAATAPGHKGCFQYYRHQKTGKTLCVQAGRIHGYEGVSARDAVRPVMSHRLLGTKKIILTNAAGSLSKSMDSGALMLIRDHVNLTGQNPLAGSIPQGLDGEPLGPRFPDLSEVYDSKLRTQMKKCFEAEDFDVHEGVYLGLLGPCFETPAETSLFAKWGMQAVGMSTVWEAIALKHAGTTVAGVSLITNLCAGFLDRPLVHEEFEVAMKESAVRFARGLFQFASQEISEDA
jgi:purine-nucleoside phosphorylase